MPKSPIEMIIKNLKEVMSEQIDSIKISELRQMKLADLAAELQIPAGGIIADIIKASNENELLNTLKKVSFSQLARSLSEVDKYHNNVMHWCVLLNYPAIFQYFRSKGFDTLMTKLNHFKLNPLQLATITNNQSVYLELFSRIPEFSESGIEFYDNSGTQYKFKFNDLHLAIICSHKEFVQSMVAVLLSYHKKDKYEIAHLGNLLHLFSYASLEIGSEDDVALNSLKHCLTHAMQLPALNTANLLRSELTRLELNYERLTPIAVAAKYGQEAWVEVLTPYYEKADLHHLVTEAKGLLVVAKQAQASAPSTTGMFATSAAAASALTTSGFALSSLTPRRS